MDLKVTSWIIHKPLHFKMREVLLIRLEAAGFDIFSGTRSHQSSVRFPYICYSPGYKIYSANETAANDKSYKFEKVEYEYVMDELEKIIKNEN